MGSINLNTMDEIKNVDMVLGLSSMDYVSFVLMLILCTAVGIYYGFFTGKISVTEYLVGSRNMTILPVSLSMTASVFSSSLYVGKIAETYFYGIGSLIAVFFTFSSGLVFIYIYLPALHELHLTTIYEYLHLRFGTSMRLQTSVMFIIQQVIMCPVIIYVAAMCFNEVTGINLYLVAFVTSVICILYTCVGGLKAVIWTDVIQTVAMITAVSWVAIIGTINIGGFHTVWERNYNSGRLELPSAYVDFTSRYSCWAVIFAFPANVLMMGALNQGVVQRCLCLPTLKNAQWAVIIYYIGLIFIFVMISFSGCVIYATYYECDPFASKAVQRKDQVVPYYIINTLNSVVGIKGMFIAGIFSAALSTLSTSLNGLACVLLQDFYRPFFRKTASDKECKIFMMISVVIAGLIFTALVFLVEKIGSVFQITLSLSGIVNGPLLAMFTVGLYIPSVRNKAASAGYWMGFIILLWLFIGSILIAPDANAGMKPLYTFGCDKTNTSTVPLAYSPTNTNSGSFSMYKIAFPWYTLMGFAISVLITWTLNFFMEKNDVSTMDPKLFSPLIRRFMPLKREEELDGEIKLL